LGRAFVFLCRLGMGSDGTGCSRLPVKVSTWEASQD
jgi:hypothetical protein